jgi:hypothetical protein
VLKGERCTAHSHPEKIGALVGNQKGNLEKPIILRRALRKWMSRHKHAIARKQKVAFTKVYLTLHQEIIYIEGKSRDESTAYSFVRASVSLLL